MKYITGAVLGRKYPEVVGRVLAFSQTFESVATFVLEFAIECFLNFPRFLSVKHTVFCISPHLPLVSFLLIS